MSQQRDLLYRFAGYFGTPGGNVSLELFQNTIPKFYSKQNHELLELQGRLVENVVGSIKRGCLIQNIHTEKLDTIQPIHPSFSNPRTASRITKHALGSRPIHPSRAFIFPSLPSRPHNAFLLNRLFPESFVFPKPLLSFFIPIFSLPFCLPIISLTPILHFLR